MNVELAAQTGEMTSSLIKSAIIIIWSRKCVAMRIKLYTFNQLPSCGYPTTQSRPLIHPLRSTSSHHTQNPLYHQHLTKFRAHLSHPLPLPSTLTKPPSNIIHGLSLSLAQPQRSLITSTCLVGGLNVVLGLSQSSHFTFHKCHSPVHTNPVCNDAQSCTVIYTPCPS